MLGRSLTAFARAERSSISSVRFKRMCMNCCRRRRPAPPRTLHPIRTTCSFNRMTVTAPSTDIRSDWETGKKSPNVHVDHSQTSVRSRSKFGRNRFALSSSKHPNFGLSGSMAAESGRQPTRYSKYPQPDVLSLTCNKIAPRSRQTPDRRLVRQAATTLVCYTYNNLADGILAGPGRKRWRI